jgi:hypothetical protein
LLRTPRVADGHAAVQQISFPANVCAAFCLEHALETALVRIFQRDSACATLLKALALPQVAVVREKVVCDENLFIGGR